MARARAFLARAEGGLGHAEAGLGEGAPGLVGFGCLVVHALEAAVGKLGGREAAAGEGEVVPQAGEREQEPAPAAPVGLREVEVGGEDVHQVRLFGQGGDRGGEGVDGGEGV